MIKKVTENMINSIFSSSAVIDRIRDTKSSYLIEQIKLNKEFNSPLIPAMLYNYYISVCLIRSYDLTNDLMIGRQLGYPAKTVGNVRRKLQKANWILFKKFTHKGKTYGQWFIGKEVVMAYKTSEGKLTFKEQIQLGLITEEEVELLEQLDTIELNY